MSLCERGSGNSRRVKSITYGRTEQGFFDRPGSDSGRDGSEIGGGEGNSRTIAASRRPHLRNGGADSRPVVGRRSNLSLSWFSLSSPRATPPRSNTL